VDYKQVALLIALHLVDNALMAFAPENVKHR